MKTVWILLTGILIYGTARANIDVKVHFSPVANLVYQLDCISGELPHCSRNTYQDLWNSRFIKGDEDRAAVKTWGELMERYRPGLEFEAKTGRFEGVKLSTKIRIASFQSATAPEYFDRLDLVVTPKDRQKFESVIRRFYPAFNKWWKTTARPKGKEFAKATRSLLVRRDLTIKLQQFAHFYAVDLSDNYVVHFNLFYRPESAEATSGQQIENYSVAEFLPNEKPVDRIDVIIHELCHFFYESTADGNFTVLRKGFENSGKTEARAAYNLLNETLATALGNGLINKLTMKKERWAEYSAKERSFYNDYHIDKAAKAILPWMETWVNGGSMLYDPRFVPEYVSLLQKAFGRELAAPRLMLNELILVADSKYGGKFRDAVRKSVRAASLYNSEGEWSDERLLKTYNEKTNLSALIIVHPANLSHLQTQDILSASEYGEVKSEYGEHAQVIYAFKRASSTPGYVIVAPDYEKALGLVEKIGLLTHGFEGAY